MKYIYYTFLICFLATSSLLGQSIGVATSNDDDALIQTLGGPGVTISNVNVNCDGNAYGSFNSGSFGIGNGVLLTSGAITDALGPNDLGGAGTNNSNGGNNLLDALVSDDTEDACVVTFNIVPDGNSISFNYVFGSEEYNEFVDSDFNDVFGFFISGPGIFGTQNMALLPGGAPVSIQTVNNGDSNNCVPSAGSYVDNCMGPNIQYDGHTVVLTAQRNNLIPCQTYTITLAIADVADGVWDSGVFIEQGSFSAASNFVDFHFEHENGVEDDVFNICEDVWLDGSATFNTSSFYMDIWKVIPGSDPDWLANQGGNDGWVQGSPDLLNITQIFGGSVNWVSGCTYEVKVAISHPLCGWTSETHQFTLEGELIDHDIEPFWSHPDCPEIVCEADEWPIIVLNDDGNPVVNGGGITVVWDNLDTWWVNENIQADFIFVSAFENWEATITYPDGCVYTETYQEICCEDDIFIKVFDCPSDNQLNEYIGGIRAQLEETSNPKLEKHLNDVELLRGKDGPKDGPDVIAEEEKDCDPCEIGYVLIQLVDENGDEIDASYYDTFSWDDGTQVTSKLVFLPMDNEICFTATKIVEGFECVYEDCFYYDCDDGCPDELAAPTNLQVNGTTLSWNPVPGATGYIVHSPSGGGPILNCNCTFGMSIAPIQTENNFVVLTGNLANSCFVWQVTAICGEDTQSHPSGQACYGGSKFEIIKDELKSFENVSVSPNPTSGNMIIEMDTNYETDVLVEIYDFYGNKVHSFENQVSSHKSVQWDGSNLNEGVYFIYFKTDKETLYRKVIVR